MESVLYNIPGVRDAAVIGVSDEILGQAVKAFVVLERGADIMGRVGSYAEGNVVSRSLRENPGGE